MFFNKKAKNEHDDPGKGPESPKAGKKNIFFKIIKYFFLLIILIFFSAAAVFYWICQSQSGQQWLVSFVNGMLAPKAGDKGLSFQISAISGSLPFNFTLGLESRDAKGLWLTAPKNTFTLNWKELPSCLHISRLKLADVDISRFPDLPPTEKAPEESAPFGVKELQDLLRSASGFLSEKHWWLPRIRLENIEIQDALLPPALLSPGKEDENAPTRLCANMTLNASFVDNAGQAGLDVELRNDREKPIDLSSFSFQALSLKTNLDFKPHKDILDALLNLELKIAASKLDLPDFPADFLGEDILLKLLLTAQANTSDMRPSAILKLDGPNLQAGHLTFTNNADWHSGSGWKNGNIDGKGNLLLQCNIYPLLDDWIEKHKTSPLAMLRKPINLKLNAEADLPKADILLDLLAPEIIASGHSLTQMDLKLSTKNLDIPLPPYGMDLLKKEHHVDLIFGGMVDKEHVQLSTQAFFQALDMPGTVKGANSASSSKKEEGISWLASLRELDLAILGLNGRGNVQAFIAPGEMPALDGVLNLEMSRWQAVQKFLPEQSLSGSVRMELHLDNALARDPGLRASLASSPQNLLLNLDIPSFVMQPQKSAKAIEIKKLLGHADLSDVFASPKIDLSLQANRIRAEGMGINADIKANGALEGPLNAEVKINGDIKASLAATWSPGTAILKNCDLSLTLPASMSPSGKAVPLAIHTENPASFHYGDKGFAVEKLNIKLNPSGRLQADGALSPDKLSFKINLESVDFKPWQILVPQIPLGYASLKVNLGGSPGKPNGNFDLSLRDVTLPGNPLPPFGLGLKGGIENSPNGSALALNLNLDPKSLKALGSDHARITASIPLLFASNGIPNVNMTGPLSAQIRWEGAIGPIWNLLPMPDKRLNGRVSINLNANGSLKAPKIQGGVQVNKARFEDLLLGVLLTDINLKVDLSEQGPLKQAKGALDSLPGAVTLLLNAGDGRGGTIAVNGKAAIDGNNLDIKAKINRLRPLRRRDIHIDLSGEASVAGSALAPLITGQLIVNQGEVLLNNLEMTGSVTTLPITGNKPVQTKEVKQTEERKEGGKIDFRIDMLPRFTVEGRGLTSIWTAHLLVTGSPFNPSITGNISSVRGNFDFLGKNFSLTKGVVFFGGGSISNPLVDMELTNETPDLTAHIIVSGPVNKIKIRLTSDPQLPRDEILSRVLFGRSVGDLSRFEALQLAAGVAQLAGIGSSGNILSSAKKALGVDVLRLGTSPADSSSEAGDMTAGGTTIEMGKYINDMIYMGVQQGMKADSTAFIIQMELTPRTNLEIRTEQNNTWGGLKWKYNY